MNTTRKYLDDGSAVDVIQQLNDGRYLVCLAYDSHDSDDEDDFGPSPHDRALVIVTSLHDRAPTRVYDDRVTSLMEAIEDLQSKKGALLNEISEIEYRSRDIKAKLQRFVALRHLEDFIDGRITHFVVIHPYSTEVIRILGREEALANMKAWGRNDGLKLLTLFGRTNGDLQWKLHEYSDGSGGVQEVIPTTSLEEAIAIAKAHIEQELVNTADNPREHWAQSAVLFGVKLPPQYIEPIQKAKVLEYEKNIARAQRQLTNAEEALAGFNSADFLKMAES